MIILQNVGSTDETEPAILETRYMIECEGRYTRGKQHRAHEASGTQCSHFNIQVYR